MKQVIQDLKKGNTFVQEVPTPLNKEGHVLIESKNSLVSIGTERTLVNFGNSNYLQKAMQQPEKVRQAIDKIKTEGVASTYSAITAKLDEPMPLGYCNAGVVLESSVEGISVGDRVISNGVHAEVVRIPKNLCAKIPDNVDFESASFAVLGSVALQGIRLASPALGERVVVFGLGLVGLMTVQMLLASGCKVLGIDFDSKRCELAKSYGADIVDLSKDEDPIENASLFSDNLGVDAVIITASTKSDEVIQNAAEMCRKRGKIVLVGVVGLNLRRENFYEKEITFQVSSSYGPGRYDEAYENEGIDYPIGFVRWTENRNFQAVLEMMSTGKLDVSSLITHRFDIEDASEAYENLNDPSAIAIILNYGNSQPISKDPIIILNEEKANSIENKANIGIFGGGNFSSRILLPAIKGSSKNLTTIVSSGGLSAIRNAKKYNFKVASTSEDEIFDNEEINTVFIATRHNLHARQVIKSLNKHKNVYVEKPLAITLDEITEIEEVYLGINSQRETPLKLMVGFNRRFAPAIKRVKQLLQKKVTPLSLIMTVNAGEIPSNHWTQDQSQGGGRLVGEACHFVDLLNFITDSSVANYSISSFGKSLKEGALKDNFSIGLEYENGSFGTIHYFSKGGSSFPKERLEIFTDNSTLQLDNYRSLKAYNWPGFSGKKYFRLDKGHTHCVEEFINSINYGLAAPIAFSDIIHSSKKTIEIANSL